jgi:hypothetical protein
MGKRERMKKMKIILKKGGGKMIKNNNNNNKKGRGELKKEEVRTKKIKRSEIRNE